MTRSRGKSDKLGRIFDWIVYLILFLVPLVWIPFFNLSFELPKILFFRIGVLLMLFIFVWQIMQTRKIILPSIMNASWIRKLMGLFLVVLIISTLFSIAPQVSAWGSYYRMQGLYTYLHYFLFFALLLHQWHTTDKWRRGLKFLFGGFLISLIWGIFQGFSLDFTGINLEAISLGRVFAGMGHPNYLGLYIVMLFFPFLAFLLNGKKKWLVIFLIFLSIWVFVLTGHRAGMLGMAAGGFLFLLLAGIFLAKKKQWRFILGAFLIPLVIGSFVVSANIFSEREFVKENVFLNRMVLDGENERSVLMRLEMWPSVLAMIEGRIFVGYGLETFAYAFPKYAEIGIVKYEEISSSPDRAHNSFLDVGAESGIMGMAVYLLMVFSVFRMGILQLQMMGKNVSVKKDGMMMIGILSSFFGAVVANQFGFSMTVHFVVGAFLLAYLIFLMSVGVKEKKIEVLNRTGMRKIAKVVVVIFVFGSILTDNIFVGMADHYALNGFKAIEQRDGNAAIENFYQADFWNGNQSYYKYMLASLYSQFGEYDYALNIVEKAGEFTNEEDFYYFYLKGKILASECQPPGSVDEGLETCDNAIGNFSKSKEMSPIYAPIFLESGKLEMEIGNCEGALDLFGEYLELVSDDWQKDGTDAQRIFYKNNPQFDRVFEYIEECEG